MKLHNVKIEGFRRFEFEQNLNVNSKLTAIVGPNEAGKTSLLKAIASLSNTEQIPLYDRSNATNIPTKITGKFYLDKDDLAAAKLKKPTWFFAVKYEDGQIKYNLDPRPPRDLTLRKSAIAAIKQLLRKGGLTQKVGELGSDYDVSELEIEIESLSQVTMVFTDTEIATFKNFMKFQRSGNNGAPIDEYEDAHQAVSAMLRFEEDHEPFQEAINALAGRVPRILSFTPDYRILKLPFDLNRYKNADPKIQLQPSKPLAEVLQKINVSLDDLYQAITAGNNGVKEGIITEANEKLAKLSNEVWKQSDAALYLQVDGYSLDLLVRNVKDFDLKDQFSSLNYRSDGYKQFLALQIFSFLKETENSILLIDEIEQHLHYDAQADLVQFLQSERTIGSVIYTTHSAGALPEDLGVGIRMVEWNSERKKNSVIINKFWSKDNSGGFKPILFGMGATTMAFFPMRKALIGEGPTELLLLPRLFKEALNLDSLNFQIVHGLSHVNLKALPVIDSIGKTVCYFVDNDDSGQKMKAELLEAHVPEHYIFSVQDIYDQAITIEDLLEKDIWLRAVNAYIDMYGKDRGVSEPILECPDFGRIEALPLSIRKEKISFCYSIVEEIENDPKTKILNRNYKIPARKLALNINSKLSKLKDTMVANSL